jgi:hypothetical protein
MCLDAIARLRSFAPSPRATPKRPQRKCAPAQRRAGLGWSRCELGLRVPLCHPCAESVNDRQADDEEANAHEDQKASVIPRW